MDMCQIVINANMTFGQILDKILTKILCLSFSKLRGPPIIKVNRKNKNKNKKTKNKKKS
jgi:hypothetical protein